ncbi:hypothetical protein GH714_035279 [Hevea brasiliensis]|uniref:N-acetyltransferase domain-containing protein n=1 Tax=Hevea brasiliensis TaxID=3981 RepID=A0A6A6KDI1_HEVBR|nr:hypothetical protein GH714_035279 [Hevea brasiliensis]
MESTNSLLGLEHKKTQKPVAFARATGDNVFNAIIWDMVVDPSYQGIGLGKAVMERLVQELLEKGIVNIALLESELIEDVIKEILKHLRHPCSYDFKGLEIGKSTEFLGKQFVVVLPGSKIPKWIQHQSTGFSIAIPLPSNWHKELLGFTFCAVFEYGKTKLDEERWMRLECQFKSNCGESCHISACFHYWERNVVPKMEHMFLSYNSDVILKIKDKGESMCCYNELLIEFFIQDSCEKPSPSSKVNKCGVRLLYNDDGDDEWDYVSSWDPTQSSLSKEDSDIYDKPSTKNVGESSALLRRKSKHMKLLHLTRMRLIPVKHLALEEEEEQEEENGNI